MYHITTIYTEHAQDKTFTTRMSMLALYLQAKQATLHAYNVFIQVRILKTAFAGITLGQIYRNNTYAHTTTFSAGITGNATHIYHRCVTHIPRLSLQASQATSAPRGSHAREGQVIPLHVVQVRLRSCRETEQI